MSDALLEAIVTEREAEEKRHEEIVQAEEERHDATMTKLGEIEDLAKRLSDDDTASPASPPQGRAKPKSSGRKSTQTRRKASPPSPKPPASAPDPASETRSGLRDMPPKATAPAAPDRSSQERQIAERRAAIVQFVSENPKSTAAQIIRAMEPSYTDVSVRNDLVRLARDGRLETTGEGRDRRYTVKEQGVTTPDGNGARTRPERAVCEALKARPKTAAGLSVELKIRQVDLDRILAGLVVRGVLYKKNTSQSAQPTFELAKKRSGE